MGRNGYFQLDMRKTGVYLLLFPEEGGGEPVSVKELTGYLQGYGFAGVDPATLGRILTDRSGMAQEMKIGEPVSFFINEAMNLQPSVDRLRLICRFYPPSEGGSMLDLNGIKSDLAYKKIKYGIREDEIERFLRERHYCTDYCLAEGRDCVIGHDARIEYFFNTKPSLSPKTNEDGSVDYKELSIISPVEKGAVLATKHPMDPGIRGIDIYGKEFKPPQVHDCSFGYGRNIHLSDDGMSLITEVTGHASLVKDQVFVSRVYEVAADVDNSTGNIDYEGSVHIKGNVKTGFVVKATGDVVIDGVVEGAQVISGGLICVRAGIHGMGKGSLHAEDNILCKFIENAEVISEHGFVTADTIMHSRVDAYDNVKVCGKKGFITGGRVRAGFQIEANYLGSAMGAATEIEVGVEPSTMQRTQEAHKELDKVEEELAKVEPIMQSIHRKFTAGGAMDAKNLKYMQAMTLQYRTLQESYRKLKKETEELDAYVSSVTGSKIVVRKTAYPGVTIKISTGSTTLTSKRDYCQYVYEGGDIVAKMI